MKPAGHASFERARFGPLRTLNVRAGMLGAEESARRVEAWLRGKQVELSGEVLIITGRGAGSVGGVPVIKESTQRILSRLRRAGIIQSFGEDSPGSFVVLLAPLRAMLEAPLRRKIAKPMRAATTATIQGLGAETRGRLRYLASRAIESLGVQQPTERQINAEMERHFSMIALGAPGGLDTDRWLDNAIARAVSEYEDSER